MSELASTLIPMDTSGLQRIWSARPCVKEVEAHVARPMSLPIPTAAAPAHAKVHPDQAVAHQRQQAARDISPVCDSTYIPSICLITLLNTRRIGKLSARIRTQWMPSCRGIRELPKTCKIETLKYFYITYSFLEKYIPYSIHGKRTSIPSPVGQALLF